MKVFNEETNGKAGGMFILIMDKKEAIALVDMTEAAAEACKKKRSWRKWADLFSGQLDCF